jgi:hypothetical protein
VSHIKRSRTDAGSRCRLPCAGSRCGENFHYVFKGAPSARQA